MLFGCRRWPAAHGGEKNANLEAVDRMETIEAELAEWLSKDRIAHLG